MLERHQRQSPLSHLGLQARAETGLGEAGVAMVERPFRGIIDLRGGPEEAFYTAVEGQLGIALPREINSAAGKTEVQALMIGPNQWWIVTPEPDAELAERLREGLGGLHASITEIGDSRTCIHVTGPAARALLLKGCPLDLHPSLFAAGQCTASVMAKADMVLHQRDEAPSYDLYVLCSFADYLWRWMEDAAGEYGLTVLSE